VNATVDLHNNDVPRPKERNYFISACKVAVSFEIIITTCVTRPYVLHNTTPDLQNQDQDHSVQDQDQDRFLVSDRSCPKTI